MNDGLNRTAEWSRLSRSGLFKVKDAPGSITLTRPPPFLFRVIGLWLALVVVQLVFAQFPNPLSGVVPLLAAPFYWLCLYGLWRSVSPVNRVRFTPEGVMFWNALGLRRGWMDRDSMQQIAVATDHRNLTFHRFIADVGTQNAFFGIGTTGAALRNNVLMVAFAQPLHLDVEHTAEISMASPVGPQLKVRPLAAR